MKFGLLFIFLASLLACGESEKSMRLNIDSPSIDTVNPAIVPEKLVIREDSLAGRPITFYLQHPGIAKIAKEMFHNYIEPNRNDSAFRLMDSLFSISEETKAFYFLIITRTMSRSDGAYAEGLGSKCKRYIETNPAQFASYFLEEKLLTETDFANWAQCTAFEILIDAEQNHEKAEVKATGTKMKANCKNCTAKQSEKLNEFIRQVQTNIVKYTR